MLNFLLLWQMKATFSNIKYSNFTTTEHKSPRVVKLQVWCADLANPLTMPPAMYSLRLFICINHFPDVSTTRFYWNLLSMASVCFCPIQFSQLFQVILQSCNWSKCRRFLQSSAAERKLFSSLSLQLNPRSKSCDSLLSGRRVARLSFAIPYRPF